MLRDQFLLDPGLIFLNHGSFGACPVPVLQALQHWQRETERNPVALLGRRSADLLRQARDALAAALGADTDDLVFMPNATTGVNTVARSLALTAGDEVLTTDHEYGACDAAGASSATGWARTTVVSRFPCPTARNLGSAPAGQIHRARA
jgi:isopenicillin-N epimerase